MTQILYAHNTEEKKQKAFTSATVNCVKKEEREEGLGG